jgi:hypothetical protein
MANRFVVSTTHHLLGLDPESKMLWRIHSGAGLYYGLAKDANGSLYVACRNTVWGSDNDQVRASEEGAILVLDQNLRVCDKLRPQFPLRDVHGIACFDGRIWVTCSYDNLVAIFDLATREWTRWYPATDPSHRDRDVHHFNTIQLVGGQVCLLAHNFGPSELLWYDYPSLRYHSAIPFGHASHDLFVFENAVATCSSADGWIVNSSGQRLRTGNFPRGVATTPDGNLLGLSMCSPRDKRQLQHAVLRWYASNWRFKSDFILQDVGMVLDILPLGDESCWRDSLEVWRAVEITTGHYNRLAPGNVYTPDSFTCSAKGQALEWHTSEVTHRWTAALDAALSILINPGETRLRVEVSSSHPNSYSAEVYLDGHYLGILVFAAPGVRHVYFDISADSTREASLRFRVPYLWKPAETIPGSDDERLVGLAVHSVALG